MKLRVKLTLGTVALLAIIFGICGSLLVSASFDAMLQSERQSALGSYNTVQNTLQLVNSISTQSGLDDIVSALRSLGGGALWDGVFLYTDGSPVYASGDVPEGIKPDTVATRPGECSVTYWTGEESQYLQVSGRVNVNSQTLSVYILTDISDIYALRESQLSTYRRLLGLTIVIGAAGSWLMAALLTRPLTRLARTSRKIAQGDLSSRANVTSGDELETLAGEFNAMADKLEENIAELQDSVRRQTEFMGSFAHELKTPMTSIIGYADLIRRRMLTQEEEQEAANYIFSEGRRLESLSIKLLDLLILKKRDFELKVASPAAIVAGIVRVMRPQLQGYDITLRYRAADGRCLLEPDLVKSLIINLVDNARKAMDSGGAIFISSEMTDTGCAISVTDNGRGIPETELAKITEAFYRVDKSRSRAQGGAGLGLALCNEIAALHSGKLEIRSVEGRGTSITAILNGGIADEG